jgi:hypothetical protein
MQRGTWGMPMVPSGFLTGATSTGSQAIGASAAANIRCTAVAISGPDTDTNINQQKIATGTLHRRSLRF